VDVTKPDGTNALHYSGAPTSNRYTGSIEGPLMQGEWVIKVQSFDYLGNASECERTIVVESPFLTLTAAKVFPNPFAPSGADKSAHTNATIQFELSKSASDVTIKIYDFGGRLVRTLKPMAMNSGLQNVEWAGDTDDGTLLANGPYLCRIVATDGVRTESSELKVVIWRE